ncbi:MAG: S1C family serine protease [Aggregatilineales bacterium]
MSLRYAYTVIVLLMLVACEATVTPEKAIQSTPLHDLPVSVQIDNTPVIPPTPVSDAIIAEADAEYLLMSNVYARSTPSIVNIEATMNANNTERGRGSGFVYSMDGHIVTGAHVVKDAISIQVTFNDGYITSARTLGIDTYSDLAVIQVNVDETRLAPLPIADSDSVRVGQRAIAIGNPFGLNSSMSAGIVSGLGRTLRSAALIDTAALPGFQNPAIIQTDTPINPGNSGGPLLNSRGQVIGVTTAIRTDSGIFQGVGFAVPSNTMQRIIPELITNGQVDYAWMGISVAPEEDGYGVAGLSDALNLPVDAGILIRGVSVDSPADRAGLQGGTHIVEVRGQSVCQGGDIIVAINEQYVATMDELVAYIITHVAPDDTVILRVVRDSQSFDIPMTLASRPAEESSIRDCTG